MMCRQQHAFAIKIRERGIRCVSLLSVYEYELRLRLIWLKATPSQ